MTSQKPKQLSFLLFAIYLSFCSHAKSITLDTGQENFSTTSNITEIKNGIESSLFGTSDNYNSITNNHTITTGDDGAESSAYGITITGNYNEITNNLNAQILTTGSSGRAIDVDNFAIVKNFGEITTQGSSAHGIYAVDNNEIYNSNIITTNESSAVGIYINGDNNIVENSGTIITNGGGYGVRLQGNVNNFTNSGSITTNSGSTSYGIYISAASALNADADNFTTAINSGTITSNSHGIYNLDSFANIINSGSIISDATRSSQNGIRSLGDNVIITNYGNITSHTTAIYNSGNNVIINNYGNITGEVRLGNSTLNILGGTISGKIDGTNNLGNISIGSDDVSGVEFSQENDFINLNNLTIKNNSILSANFEINANLIEIDNGSTLSINENANITAPIRGLEDEAGNIEINANFSSNFALGESGKSLANINIKSNANLAISSDIYSKNTNVFGTFDISSTNNLTINGNVFVENNGQLKIGNNSQIISKNLELKENATLQISLTNGNAGNLNIGESAIINENAKLQIDVSQNNQYIANNTSYNIISASDISEINEILGKNITIDNTNSNILGLLEFSTKISDEGLNLHASRVSSQSFTKNNNITNIYHNLNEISANSSGSLLDFQKYLNSDKLSIENAETIIEQIAPFPAKAVLNNSLLNISAMANLSEDRLLNYENVAKKHQAFWVKGIGQKTTQNKVKDDSGFNSNTSGIVVGFDKENSDNFILGFALSYLRSNTKTENGLQNNVTTSHQAQIYSRKNFNDYFFDNFFGISLNHFNQKRSIDSVSKEATASYFGQTMLLKTKFGKQLNLKNNFIIIPHSSLKYVFSNIDNYQEKGVEELNLNVSKITANFLESEIGTNIGWQTTLPKIEYNDFKFSHLTTLLNISYSHILLADKSTLKANLQNQSLSFDYKISQIDKSKLNLGFLISLYNEYDAVFNLNLKHQISENSQNNFFGFDFVQRF